MKAVFQTVLAYIRSTNTWAQNAHFFAGYSITITPWAMRASVKWTWIAATVMLAWAAGKEIWFDKYIEHPGPDSQSDWEDLFFYLLGIGCALVIMHTSKGF